MAYLWKVASGDHYKFNCKVVSAKPPQKHWRKDIISIFWWDGSSWIQVEIDEQELCHKEIHTWICDELVSFMHTH